MIKVSISRFFRSERENTDKSLVAERERANESLQAASLQNQGQTDEIVKDERVIADRMTAESRARHDRRRVESTPTSSGLAVGFQISEERRRTDLATELERSKVDAAILQEREVTVQLVDQVLELEREATDQNLLLERRAADTGFADSTRQLKTEMASHLATQSNLTSRDEFLAIVSHDLKNPMGAVSAYADLLLEGEPNEPPLGVTARSFVDAIKRNADISLRLIADLLDVERISHGKLHLELRRASSNGLATEIVERFIPAAREKGVELSLECVGADQPLLCDRDRVLQVLGNLVGNALKFTPTRGRVLVAVSSLANETIFRISDTGPGIPSARRAEVFERFAQLKSADRQGLGLGLFIAKMLVELHGGKIWIESVPASNDGAGANSNPSQGTVFALSFPSTFIS